MAYRAGGKQDHTKHRWQQDSNELQEGKVVHRGIAPVHHLRRAEDCCSRWSLALTGKMEVGVQSRNITCPSFDRCIACSTSACRGRCSQWQIMVNLSSDVQPMRMWVL